MQADGTWNRMERVFEQALQLPAEDRVAWVREHCASDPAVRDEVLAMLGAQENLGEFLSAPLLDFTGQQFGRYTAAEEVGRGGMSVVYRGHRTGGDFSKEVAIKVVLLQSAAGMGEGETQILAGLEHPHIARLLDGGTTELGFRYLVMEFVKGQPFTEYSAGRSEAEKLQLFLDVCGAVQYAHRALVVHRDLKPDNILVTAEGTVKLLDFGIAKILNPAAGAEQTRGLRAFSPNYASPEQLLGQPVTTATDIYSLGVLLCELLTGKPPRAVDGLTLEEMVDAARQSVVAVPLQGELGAIVLKALRTDPEARYESAGAMARDMERYRQGMPVEAQAPTWSYRARKFVGRHRLAVGAGSLAAVGLMVSTGVAVWQAQRAELRFNQVRELARAVMFDLHDEVKKLPGSLEARKVIVDRSVKYLDTLAEDTSASTEVKLDLARGYLRLAEIEGKDLAGMSLGRSGDALAHSRKAVEIARPVSGQDVESQRVLLDAIDSLAAAHTVRGDIKAAQPFAEEAMTRATALAAADPRERDRLAAVAKQLADIYSKSPEREKALPLFRRSLELRAALAKETPGDLRRQQRLAEAHSWISADLWRSKQYAESEQHARECLRLEEARFKAEPRLARANLASAALQVAMLSLRAKRYEEAIDHFERGLELRREVAQEDPKSATSALRVVAALDRIGLAYREWGRHPEAIRFGQQALAEAKRVRNLDPANATAAREYVYALGDLALSYQQAGQKPQACTLARETVTFLKGKKSEAPLDPTKEKMTRLLGACGG